ncbi:MAG: hypothetical protein J07HX64_01686 [halophilic archaeon J07HX64]|jgi:Uncharacterized protein conserved in archaea|nr:MAG: hypothetical protein J07HX64_01686 [halophilic archaeon J07HX64]
MNEAETERAVVGIVGLPGSGKSEAATVAEELDVPVVTMGDVIRAACRERDLDPATHHGQVAQQLRAENGPAAIAEASLPSIEDGLADAGVVVVDGIRSEVEVERFETAFGDAFTLVSVETPFETRAERLDLRNRDADSNEGGESLAERDEREREFGMGEAMDRAGLTLENTGSLERFHDEVRKLLHSKQSPEESTEQPYTLEAEITAPVYDTELTERVTEAITGVFPDADTEFEHGELRATVHNLEHLSELLHRQSILDTARGVFFGNQRGDTFSFRIKKQAAFVGVVNFVVDDPGELGAIAVRVRVEEPSVEAVINNVAPPTEDGKPVDV